jgi:MoaA/NifB/PqqE/SkfB family radical SAM enzyme
VPAGLVPPTRENTDVHPPTPLPAPPPVAAGHPAATQPAVAEPSTGAVAPGLRARLAAGVRLRRESAGAIVYVPRRDRFFALDDRYAAAIGRLGTGLRGVRPADRWRVAALAEYGICVTEPATRERACHGRGQVGDLAALPVPGLPLVVNCFVTAHCPLRCAYCHADDLMTGYRAGEDDRWLPGVLRLAAATPAMVGVVTGGEPLSRPERTERLIARLAREKAVVLDTSGVGDFGRLLPVLHRYGVHVRVSMDSADRAVNDALRPVNRGYLPVGASPYAQARDALHRAVSAGIPCSVQTVVTAVNGTPDRLDRLRDALVELGVTTWVLHVVVPAGQAALPRRAGLLTDPATMEVLADLIRRAAADRAPIDIRVTTTHRAPNSVLLISARGELCVQNPDGGGKTILAPPAVLTRRWVVRQFRRHVDAAGHGSRYLNGAVSAPGPAGGRGTS